MKGPTHAASHRVLRDGTRRVHLKVQRQRSAGRELIRPDEPWQDEITKSTVLTARAVLGERPSLERILELTERTLASTSRLVDGLLARGDGTGVACRAGCDHCCHVVVGVTAPEALVIFEYLTRSLSVAMLARLRERIADFRERTRGLSSAERFAPEYACVFLEAGRCSIYEVRPLACRAMNSLDATECETRLRDPAARQVFVANGGGRLFVEPIIAFRAISAGLQLALSEVYGLDMRPLELSRAMHVQFEGGTSVSSAWLARREPFADALCASQ